MAKTEAFWDSSALVPLCTNQTGSPFVRALLKERTLAVWWAAPVEISSALSRLVTQGHLSQAAFSRAERRAQLLQASWAEVTPSNSLRELARELTTRHRLRAADALQLAAALTWCHRHPRGRGFVCLDRRLAQAAASEGFHVEAL